MTSGDVTDRKGKLLEGHWEVSSASKRTATVRPCPYGFSSTAALAGGR